MPRVKRIPPRKLHPSKCSLLSGSGTGIALDVVDSEIVVVEVVVVLVEVVVVAAVVVVVIFVVEDDVLSGAGESVVIGSSPPELHLLRSLIIVGSIASLGGL